MTSIYFSYVDFPKLFPTRDLLIKTNDHPYFIKMTSIPIPKASLLMMKVVEKSSMARIGVEHIMIFNSWKDSSTTMD